MRLPVTSQLSTKDGTSNKNARLTNCLKESKKTGDKAVIRPGLVTSDTFSGIGSGLIPFDGRLLVIYDDTAYDYNDNDGVGWPFDSSEYSASTTYYFGDVVWYLGAMWFSKYSSGHSGNTPAAGTYWSRSYEEPSEYDASTLYTTGELVTYNGVIYRAAYVGSGVTPDSGGSISPQVGEDAQRWATWPTGSGGVIETASACIVNYAPLTGGRTCAVVSPTSISVGKVYNSTTLTTPMWVAI